jgi:hypothetical protein
MVDLSHAVGWPGRVGPPTKDTLTAKATVFGGVSGGLRFGSRPIMEILATGSNFTFDMQHHGQVAEFRAGHNPQGLGALSAGPLARSGTNADDARSP